MIERSYSDLSDSATTFDPEEQFDRDIDERMKGMSKEEAVNIAISAELEKAGVILAGVNPGRAAIAAADKWDAEEKAKASAIAFWRASLRPGASPIPTYCHPCRYPECGCQGPK